VKRHEEALEILFILRRRLLDRLAEVVVSKRNTLLNGHNHSDNPISSHSDLTEMIRNLSEIDHAITGLADAVDESVAPTAPPTEATKQTVTTPAPIDLGATANGNHLFARYLKLLGNNRPEEASRELSRVLHVPLDRVNTASRYVARSLKADPTVADRVADLGYQLGELDESEAMKQLMRVFGFQAVEARMAVQALQSGIAGSAQ